MERNIPLFKVFMSEDVLKPVNDVLMSGYVGQGLQVDKFEEILSNHFGNPYINLVNNGTSGIHLALHMIKDKTEDAEILTVPITCAATNIPILSNNLKIKWVDTDVNTCNVDVQDLLRKLSPKTKGIVVVHWGGYPCDLDELKAAQKTCEEMYGFMPPIIEDCAHAWCASYKNKLLGNHGNICVFSLQAIKHLTTCDGGILICSSDEMHRRAKLLRWYGLDRTLSSDFRCSQNIAECGYKMHMNDVMATIGIYNFPYSLKLVKQHRDNGEYYNEKLKDIPGIVLFEHKSDRESSYWIYTMKVQNRNGFIKKMKEKGIMTSQVHDRNDKHKCFSEYKSSLPGTDKLCKEMIAIPCGWWVTEGDREYIVNTIKEGW